MKITRQLLIVLLLVTHLVTGAQSGNKLQRMKITDSGELYSTFSWDDNPAAKTAVVLAVTATEFSDIVKYSNESYWPSAISTLDGRNNMRDKIDDYVVYKVADFDNRYLLKIPAGENYFMPSNMQSSHDFYFVIGKSGAQVYSGFDTNQGTSSSSGQRMKITDPGELYSGFDIDGNSDARNAIKNSGAGSYNSILDHAKESGWPSGIQKLDDRLDKAEKMKEYVVYKVAEFGDKVLLKIPASENKHMASNMQASYDFYFVIGQKGVTPYGNATSGSKYPTGTRVNINSTGGMYSTFNLETSNYNSNIRNQLGAEYSDVITYSNEKNWPSGISTFDNRDRVRDKLNNYHAWKIAEFEDKCILRIPASENKHMPYDMQPSHDIYFVISKSNISSY